MQRLALFLALLSGALAQHSHNDHNSPSMAMNMTMHEDPEWDLPEMPSYFGLEGHYKSLTAHIALMTLAWAVALPIVVMMSIARSPSTFFAQLVFLAVNALGLVVGAVYNAQTLDLYENNAHHPMGWIVTCLLVAWVVVGAGFSQVVRLVHFIWPSTRTSAFADKYERMSLANNAAESLPRPSPRTDSRWSSRNQSLDSNNTLTSDTDMYEQELLEDPLSKDRDYMSGDSHDSTNPLQRAALLLRTIFCGVIERTALPLGFAVYCSGIVVYGGIFRSHHIFGGMAHFVKGGIFLWYGILVLGRWGGSFGDLGWSWNARPTPRNRFGWIPTAEFAESALIFVYGASNFFLEHLSPSQQGWGPHDFEHVGITVLFFGGGLLGMLIESSGSRKLLERHLRTSGNDPRNIHRPTSRADVSMNPIPGIVILLLGLMMSSHAQHSPTSGALHVQWGNLFAVAALARGVTYITLWIKPPEGQMPTRPPSELVAAYCLIGGGLLFMMSCADSVAALEHYGLDPMFAFTVAMGFTALVMAWIMVVLIIKGSVTPVSRH